MQATVPIVSEVRKFNRFYTKVLGLLNQQVYDSPFSLTETRILFEINSTSNCTAKFLQEELDLDRGYVSRILKRYEELEIIFKQKGKNDGRTYYIHLTEKGQIIYHELEMKAEQQVKSLLKNIEPKKQQNLIESMRIIEMILSEIINQYKSEISIRDEYTEEDKETIIERQRAFYSETFGFDETFSDYLHHSFEGKIKKIWIAEDNGKFAGCVGLVEDNETTALLRWFIVDPSIRGKGIGTKLVQTLLKYCKEQQYERVYLWTVSSLPVARRLYAKFGFKITKTKEEQLLWGQRIVEERWDLELK
ncbi:helix-turn-helix domain-containing GNAT family N-acetyltransferase [Cytobacillus sp. FSL W7-1323]|uniref:bifunctional helix-turn-helix transcriptional regulator/GNAT family N-acetyltransferase n=1 Tax=Cytobacillus TaxID=2675230 RepID=UPI0027876FD1|nr:MULTISPECIES: helix-turn-helix domain-containing GNAT family N-acetyltransferase [Cytobacillus]MDQ0187767.1 DNA-binding MarR family transcriptional regulator/N-acetylglutamate synthase-like GNAT family acetyltransferase [Cytobacillus kochii]MEA1855563.1 helix-turn-helix domain-containing GNAT family N-acetyltransferase [Cytobacillus sp. OWB-43]